MYGCNILINILTLYLHKFFKLDAQALLFEQTVVVVAVESYNISVMALYATPSVVVESDC